MINHLHVGQTFTVALKGNPSTGYSWSYRIIGDSNSVIINSEYMSGSMIGSGGTYTFHGQAIRTGTFSIIFSYSRPWENVPPVKSLRYNFVISQRRVGQGEFSDTTRILAGVATAGGFALIGALTIGASIIASFG